VRALPPDRVRIVLRCRGNPEAPLAWLTTPGHAEFRLLHPRDDALEAFGPDGLPEGYEVKTYRTFQFVLARLDERRAVETPYVVERRPLLVVDGFDGVSLHTGGRYKTVTLTFRFGGADAESFACLTALHAGRRMAMLIDGEMFFPPSQIDSVVAGGIVQVSGIFYAPPLRKLVKTLDCGSLPGRLVQVTGQDPPQPAGPAPAAGD
jgi:preprotein translocase subunit SecD